MRMSSGASTAYEKPRSGRSICIDETPRSSRITSARTPFEASCPSTAENSPWWRRAFTPVSRRKRSKNGATVGSRSTAISFPSRRSRCASRVAWPPAPKVPSTTVSPGRGSRFATTSSARTGTWSVSVGKTLGNIFRAPFDLVQLCAPGGAIPDLEVVGHPGHRHLACDSRRLEQRGGHHHAALLVELEPSGAGEEVPPQLASVGRQRVDRLDPLGEPPPFGLRPRVEAAVEAAAHDDPILERPAELGREREAVFLIQRMLVLTPQHGPLRTTLTHFPPLVTSGPRGGIRSGPARVRDRLGLDE